MIRPILALTVIAALAGCGGDKPSKNLHSMSRGPAATAVPVSGTISSKSAKQLLSKN